MSHAILSLPARLDNAWSLPGLCHRCAGSQTPIWNATHHIPVGLMSLLQGNHDMTDM